MSNEFEDEPTKKQPPVNKSELDILKEKFDAFEIEFDKLGKENVELRIENERLLSECEKDKYKTRKDFHSDDDLTENEVAGLKLMQSQGRVNESTIAQLMRINNTAARNLLNELVRKGFANKNTHRRIYGQGTGSITYFLNEKGDKFLVDHNLTE